MKTSWEIFYRSFIEKGGYIEVLKGLRTTVLIAVVGLIIGIIIGTIIAMVKVLPQYKLGAKILSKIGDVYVALFRGTPIVVQLLLVYFVICPAINFTAPKLGMNIENYRIMVSILVYGMNSGAYVSEIMRGGIQSVDIGQMEAGRSLGMSYCASIKRIVIPQAVKNITPTLGKRVYNLG